MIFSRPPETADDVLRRLAATLRDGAIVVTSDRAVQSSAHRVGAAVLTAEAFVDAATEPAGEADDVEEDDTSPRRGPHRRPSREARATERALRRLRGR